MKTLGRIIAVCAALLPIVASFATGGPAGAAPASEGPQMLAAHAAANPLDAELAEVLARHGFTGGIETTLETRLGRPIDPQLADLGRMLWFDTITGLADDNACAGCHSPSRGFGDTQSIAIGIDNNGIVGPDRTGPRNQRRSPLVVNTAFYPNLMWNSRFRAVSDDPFDASQGLEFPAPEGLSLSHLPHLLVAQAFIPPTERNEVAGFEFPGDNFIIRDEVLRRLNGTPEYRRLFARNFAAVRRGGSITFDMFGAAIAEFEFSLSFANAPVDRFARGQRGAMKDAEKRGALLFFGRAGCVSCHAVSGTSNEMFSDFQTHAIGVPQIAPASTNSVFDGPGQDEDFGLEQVTGNPADRYRFRTSPLRNCGIQPTFFHNGAATSVEQAVRHHLNVFASARGYQPTALDADLRRLGPIEPVLARVDARLLEPILLGEPEIRDLVAFVSDGLLDPRVRPEHLMKLIPDRVPSGRAVMTFQSATAGGTNAPTELAAATQASSPGTPVPPRAGLLRLHPPHPNPALGAVQFSLDLPEARMVRWEVFDAAGRRVHARDLGRIGAGSHSWTWTGTTDGGAALPAGLYLLKLRAGEESLAAKVMVAR